MYWKGGYQDKDQAVSATTTKLKGIALTNGTELNITVHGGIDGNRIWDVADYVMPPQVSSPVEYTRGAGNNSSDPNRRR